MAQRGGKREGAWRKRGFAAIQADKARDYVVQRVADELEPIMTAQIESAKGLFYEKKEADGVIKVYQDKPDINAGKYLIDQTIGKAKETVEMGGKDGKPIEVSITETLNKIYGDAESSDK